MRHLKLIIAAFLVTTPFFANADPIIDSEPNDSAALAQNIDGVFGLSFDALIENASGINTSTIVPHAEISGTGDGTYDWFSFTVATSGSTGVFDIDCAGFYFDNTALCLGLGFADNHDSWLNLYDTDGVTYLEVNDDGLLATDTGSHSGSTFDSFIDYTFASSGTYYIRVGSWPGLPVYAGSDYRLNVSIENHAVPEPGTLALLGIGLFGMGLARRRKAV